MKLRPSFDFSNVNSIKSKQVFITGILLAVLVTGCGQTQAAKTKSEPAVTESTLFQSALSKSTVKSFGFPEVEYDTIWLKEYADPKREGIDKEIVEVIPDYCMPVASLYSDSPKSGALLLLNQSMDDAALDSNLTLAVRSYADAESAKAQFDLLTTNAGRCGTWIPKDESGESGLSMDLWEQPDSVEESRLAWSNGVYSESGVTGVVGSVIYDVYVKMDGNLSKAKGISEKVAVHVQNKLNTLQLKK